ncbi:alpha/beta hydrolase [Paraferrimonas sp. SM1919]|uniref:alpha/beta hydrolase n=1 Tax=Paraferrimonas sp. SM1919 TaxID=2662263 RepID=UPI0013D7F5FF|nr:alpha/beta hydrolase [Paraferrimonas sp. SM1919]
MKKYLLLLIFYFVVHPTSAAVSLSTLLMYTEQNAKLTFSIFEPQQNPLKSAVLMLHGGDWQNGSTKDIKTLAQNLAESGLLVVTMNYRLSSHHNKISPADSFVDICFGLSWLKEHSDQFNFSKEKVALFGIDASAQLASLAGSKGCGKQYHSANNGGPNLMVLLSPALKITQDQRFKEFLPSIGAQMLNSPFSYLRSNMPPTLILQGQVDEITPLAQSQDFCHQMLLLKNSCHLEIFENRGHLLETNHQNKRNHMDNLSEASIHLIMPKLQEFLIKYGFLKT